MEDRSRREFLTMFFGRVVARDVLGPSAPADDGPKRSEARREKPVPIMAAQAVSPHVIDLKPWAAPVARPDLDLEQKVSVLSHAVRRTFGREGDEKAGGLAPRRPRKPVHASLKGFALLPFALMALPFRKKQDFSRQLPAVSQQARAKVLSSRAKPMDSSAFGVISPLRSAPVGMTSQRAAETPIVNLPAAPPKKRDWGHIHVPVPSIVFHAHPHWGRRVAAFAAIALVVSLPLHALLSYAGLVGDARAIAESSGAAIEDLRDAGAGALRLDPAAAAAFQRAAASFAESRKRVQSVTVRLGAIVSGNGGRLAGGDQVLAAGEALSRAGAAVSAAFEALESSPASVTDRLGTLAAALAEAVPHLDEASIRLDAVPLRAVPESRRAAFESARTELRFVREDLRRLAESAPLLQRLLGASGKRRYLVVFQNSRELRPTGGFIGSFALMDVKDGAVERLEIPAGGPYDLRAGLMRRVAAPEQLRLVNARWEFQDANWFADFPTSAGSLIWFYEQSGGPTVDGVVAVTSDLMVDLLRALGPVEMAEYGKTVTAENFYEQARLAVEVEYDREANRPKQFISDMAPKLLAKLVEEGRAKMLPLADALTSALSRKDVLVWFRDGEEQALASSFGWTGELSPLPGGDFLAVAHANIAGGKTDGLIEEEIGHESEIREDGTIVDTVTIRRTHAGRKDHPVEGVKNIDYVRVYAPEGSVLLSAEGFEAPGEGYFLPADDTLQPSTLLQAIEGGAVTHEPSGTRVTRESGLTAFGNWIQLEPGETRSVRLSYRLPFTLSDLIRAPETGWERFKDAVGAYVPTAGLKLVVRKQPGASNRTFSSLVRLPDGWRLRSLVPPSETRPDGLAYRGALEHDLYLGMVLVKE